MNRALPLTVAAVATVLIATPPPAVASTSIPDGSVTSAKIKDGTILNRDIAASTLTGGRIANGSITGTDLADGTVRPNDLNASVRTVTYNSITSVIRAQNGPPGYFYAGNCPTGQVPISGGYQIEAPNESAVQILGSSPAISPANSVDPARNTWMVHTNLLGNNDASIKVIVVCAPGLPSVTSSMP